MPIAEPLNKTDKTKASNVKRREALRSKDSGRIQDLLNRG